MDLRLYNTLKRKKEKFKPLKDKQVGIYSCGPTVYWYQHIGNLRSYVFPDILKRVLGVLGYKVKHVINVTDVGHLTSDSDTGEDKMEKAAKREGKSAKEIAEHYFKVFKEDLNKMNIIEPDVWPKASTHIKEQIKLIESLEKKGFTYKTDDGIYFNTSKLKDYGKLAKLNISGLHAGKRVTLGLEGKKHKTDFALWKFSSDQQPKRQQEWNSPWGVGFPGWHIECSAMSMKYLGNTFDIHTGGEDHIPIHHTNEIAQSEAATGKTFVKYWLHGAFLMFKGEKVSKSKGGLYTLSELEKLGYKAMHLRYFYLMGHYRKPLEFSLKNLDAARNAYEKLQNILVEFKKSNSKANEKKVNLGFEQFMKFVDDDLNMPRALSYMWEIIRDQRLNEKEKYLLVMKFDKIFGLELDKVKEEKVKASSEVKKLLNERNKARKEKDFVTADKIRDKLNKLGFVIEDTEKGSFLKKR